MSKIGVFDSGVGGKSVADALVKAFPEDEILYRNDSEHIPYGNKSPEKLLELTLPILIKMQQAGCDVIVIACNTVSTTIIKELTDSLSVPLIPVEPMIEAASSQSKTKVIAVCATPSTLASSRYKQLKRDFAEQVTVLEPDCSDWALMIESNQIDRQKIQDTVEAVSVQNADVIVLACTHYHWIEDIITKYASDRAVILQPEETIVSQVSDFLVKF